ncbi:hypothetical protein LIER_40952 [Lithospermum erythrorhizon]|uniref:Uncharacterized protein n=1 Tax=Lithospermum erythrorhizon TaxID=34254 RepID=A0AAV3R271_LITER
MNEAILEGREKRAEMRLESINHDFGGNLVGCIAEANRSKFIYRLWVTSFWDKSNEGNINFFQDVAVVKELKSCFSETIVRQCSNFFDRIPQGIHQVQEICFEASETKQFLLP